MIEHVYRRAAGARGIDAVVVATDDERIAAAVEEFGGIVRLTKITHRTGTDRIAEIASDLSCDILVNVQGDLPLIEPAMIAEVVEPLTSDPTVTMTTLRQATSDPSDISSPHVVKVVVDNRGDALYFSRSPIPFRRDECPALAGPRFTNILGYTAFGATSCSRLRRSLRRRSSRLNRSSNCARSNTDFGSAQWRPDTNRSK
jgi:3-deoxy-D-manno-octulosonate cytidylyltransferase